MWKPAGCEANATLIKCSIWASDLDLDAWLSIDAIFSIWSGATQQSIDIFYSRKLLIKSDHKHLSPTNVVKADKSPTFSSLWKVMFEKSESKKKNIIMETPDLCLSASLSCCYFYRVIFWIGYKRVDFILTGLLCSFNLQWKCTEMEGWAEGLVDRLLSWQLQ